MLWKGLKQRKNNNVKKDDNNMKIEENNKVIRMTKLLIKINIPGSSGPLRFLVNHNDLVSEVIRSALKLYTRQQRLPLLGSDPNSFLLYSSNLDDFQGIVYIQLYILCININGCVRYYYKVSFTYLLYTLIND